VTSPATRHRRYRMGLRRALWSEPLLLGVLIATIAVLTCAIVETTQVIPTSVLALPVIVAGIWLSWRSLVSVAVVSVAAMVIIATSAELSVARALAFGVNIAITLVVLAFGRSRHRLGVRGVGGESMLVDLRDRLVAQGAVPVLPRGWHIEVVHRSAGRARFSGDFLVASRTADGTTVELALVDVSGKGLAAGTRALMLSGAFGGLLGSLPPKDFLPAANAYLLRRNWGEGFATAVHVVIDLTTGSYEVRTAGHPPAVQYLAGSGHWRPLPSSGGLLGVFESDKYEAAPGHLGHGDALLLYTDGLVEGPGRDFDVGIDKLMGEAERLVARGFEHGARTLVDRVPASDADDRALVLLWRG